MLLHSRLIHTLSISCSHRFKMNSLDTLFGDGNGMILGEITEVEASEKLDKVLHKKDLFVLACLLVDNTMAHTITHFTLLITDSEI